MKVARNKIRAISATMLATLASVATVYVQPHIIDATQEQRAFYVAFGAPILYIFFYSSEKILLWYHYRNIIGTWHYVTISNSSFKDQNYASMNFYFNSEGNLHYSVQLFSNSESLRKERNSRGVAHSEALDYDANKNELHILYNVNLYSDGLARRGRLNLHYERRGVLRGEWSSVVFTGNDYTISRGEMFAARPKAFSREYTEWLRHKEVRL